MGNKSMSTRRSPLLRDAELTDQRAHIALKAALALLLPLVRWLVRNGVHYASFAPALKSVFVEAARRELADTGTKLTDSAVSVLAGVQRRDIRELHREPVTEPSHPKTPSVASQVFTRWITDPMYRDARNRPVALPKTGAGRSFDALARQVSSDVHPRTLLTEMLRLGVVEQTGERVRLCKQGFVPHHGFEEGARTLSSNVSDHIAAAANNLQGSESRFLEQSVYAHGLTAPSIEAIGVAARRAWATAMEQIVREATSRYQHDRSLPEADMRMRFGVYYYAEPEDRGDDSADPALAPR
jgi:hypothetical protein